MRGRTTRLRGKQCGWALLVGTLLLICSTGTAAAYHIAISAPSTVPQGSALEVTGSSDLPPDVGIDLALSAGFFPGITTRQVFTDGNGGFRAAFATGELSPGSYYLSVPPPPGYPLDTESVTYLRVQVVSVQEGAPGPTTAPLLILIETVSPTPATGGRIEVQATPSGAVAVLDATDSQITPCTFWNVEPGIHSLEVRRIGYLPWNIDVWVGGGETTHLSVTLTPSDEPLDEPTPAVWGNFRITSQPPGAEVYIDGTYVGVTPVGLLYLHPGNHTVVLKREGYEPWQTREFIRLNLTRTIEAVLTPVSTQPPTSTPSPTPSPTLAGLEGGIAVFGCALGMAGVWTNQRRNM